MLLQYCKFIHKTQTFDSHFTISHLYILRFDSDAYGSYRRSSQGNHVKIVITIFIYKLTYIIGLKAQGIYTKHFTFFVIPKTMPIMTIYVLNLA